MPASAVMLEAKRLARLDIKRAMMEHGIKVSHVPAAEFTKVANALLNATPWYIEQAQRNLNKTTKQPKS